MLKFYYNPLTCSLGVQIALLATQAPHQLVEVDLQSDREPYRRINPFGTVPALQTSQGLLTESTAIILWLAQAYPSAQLLPTDIYGRAQGVSFLSWLSSTVQGARRQTKMPNRFTINPDGYLGVQANGKNILSSCLEEIERRLTQKSWILGEKGPTACDYQLMVYANWFALDGIDLMSRPNFSRWRDNMLLRSEVRKALEIVRSPLLSLS